MRILSKSSLAPRRNADTQPSRSESQHLICLICFVIAITLGLGTRATTADDLTSVDGKYIRLVTDLPPSDSLTSYVASFDEAVPLWLEYWSREKSSIDDWRMTGYLMTEKASFQKRNLVPNELPDFTNGYQRGEKLWVVNQPSDFYTLHLLLHEGAHGIAEKLFGGAGPPWYMEGTAEYLATHAHGETGLQIGIIPASREVSPYWGRLGLIADRRRESKMPTIETVMRYGDTAHREVEPYAWSWVAATLMEMYPEYRDRFRAAATKGRDSSPQFTRQFYQDLSVQWPVVSARWQLLCNDLEYGFDRDRNRVMLKTSPLLTNDAVTMRLATDQGWQSAPVSVQQGQHLIIEAAGRYQLQTDPKWKSEANGVTIDYYRGIPLGRVVACFVPQAILNSPYMPKLEIVSIGAKGEAIAPCDGWLLLKVNDRPSSLADNSGSLDLRLQLEPRK